MLHEHHFKYAINKGSRKLFNTLQVGSYVQITWPPEISVSVILRADLYLVNNSYSLAMKTIASGFKHLYDVIKSSKYL